MQLTHYNDRSHDAVTLLEQLGDQDYLLADVELQQFRGDSESAIDQRMAGLLKADASPNQQHYESCSLNSLRFEQECYSLLSGSSFVRVNIDGALYYLQISKQHIQLN